MAGIARRVREGDMLMSIEKGGNAIVRLSILELFLDKKH